jgi:hypothetical protein
VCDVSSSEKFALCTYLATVFGDILAMSMIMCMKGHNSINPCHMCKIDGLCVPVTAGMTHYVLLDWSCHVTSMHIRECPVNLDTLSIWYI